MRHTKRVVATEALGKLGAREAMLMHSEGVLRERQGRLSEAATAAQRELLTLRLVHQQVTCGLHEM